jgi:OOP family OmpA-OmpF porin
MFHYGMKGKKMKKGTTGIVLATALLGATVAQASEFSGLYIGGKMGMNRSDISGVANAASKNSETFGFEEGYNWDVDSFLVGGSFFADFNQKTTHTAVPNLHYGSNTIGLDLKLGLPSSNWMPYAKLGWARVTGSGVFPASQFKYTNDLHLGLGVEYKFAPNWSAVGELTTAASKVNGSKLDNQNITIGLNYYFDTPVAAPVPVAAVEPIVKKEEPKAAPAPVVAPEPVPETWKTLLENKPVCIEGANFEFDSAKLRNVEVKKLNEVVSFAEKYHDAQLEADGHTDSIGTEAYNRKLSERRAESVKAYLVKKGVAADRITTVGHGESKPIADNKTREGRELNRRVEVCTVLKVERKVRVIK